jgi:hypothetical protein
MPEMSVVHEMEIKWLTYQIKMTMKDMIDTAAVHVTCVREILILNPG